MNVDSFFTIGSTHKVCQDYVIHGNNEDEPYVILSDGCSSAADSDFGARLLCKSLQPLIYNPNYNIDSLLDSVIRNAHTLSRTLNLHDDSLSATLIFSKVIKRVFEVVAVGDCVIAAKHKDGTLKFSEYEFVSGAPYYLRYEIDNVKKGYFEEFGRKVKRTRYSIQQTAKFGLEVSEPEVEPFDFDQIFFHETYPMSDYDFVAIMSDGAKSFQKTVISSTSKQNVPVLPEESTKEILAFKGYFGEFVQRRCQKAFKQFKDQGIHNYDDFSIGVISSFENKLVQA